MRATLTRIMNRSLKIAIKGKYLTFLNLKLKKIFWLFRKTGKKAATKKSEKLRDNASPAECREFQLDGLLGWKNYDKEGASLIKDEYQNIELDDIQNSDLNDFAEELEAILINPPWNNNKFDFVKFF